MYGCWVGPTRSMIMMASIPYFREVIDASHLGALPCHMKMFLFIHSQALPCVRMLRCIMGLKNLVCLRGCEGPPQRRCKPESQASCTYIHEKRAAEGISSRRETCQW